MESSSVISSRGIFTLRRFIIWYWEEKSRVVVLLLVDNLFGAMRANNANPNASLPKGWNDSRIASFK